MWETFETSVPGKWVLAGEHSVLKGAAAVALPHPQFKLRLSFQSTQSGEFKVEAPVSPLTVQGIVNDVLEDWREGQGRSVRAPSGILKIESSIPIGAGLGSSAALCVALARWFSGPLEITGTDAQFALARELENRFHGKSSGMDIATVLACEAISFSIAKGATPLGIRKLPGFTFHDTELRSRTSGCVMQVENLRERNPVLGHELDEKMGEASRWGLEGLVRYHQIASGQSASPVGESLSRIALAMKQAQDCLRAWGLVPEAVSQREKALYERGALGVKLTGSGLGGFLVALWSD